LYRILLIVIALIVYGSLYPFDFHSTQLAGSPLWVLIHSWPTHVQSKQDKISQAQVQAMSNDLTRGALAGKVSRVLASAADRGNEKDVALRIYQFLESL